MPSATVSWWISVSVFGSWLKNLGIKSMAIIRRINIPSPIKNAWDDVCGCSSTEIDSTVWAVGCSGVASFF